MIAIKIDKLVRSKRKTLGLEISHDANLIVRAPRKASVEYIQNIIQKKRIWIQQKQKIVRDKNRSLIPKKFVNGQRFLYLGQTYCLSIINSDYPYLIFDNEFRLSVKQLGQAKEIFMEWYKKEALAKIRERVKLYSGLASIRYNEVNVTTAKRRWGSCSIKNNLYFNWRLIMAPLDVIDYVVVHELVHVIEKNHSRNFWNKVRQIKTNYSEAKSWIKEHGYCLSI